MKRNLTLSVNDSSSSRPQQAGSPTDRPASIARESRPLDDNGGQLSSPKRENSIITCYLVCLPQDSNSSLLDNQVESSNSLQRMRQQSSFKKIDMIASKKVRSMKIYCKTPFQFFNGHFLEIQLDSIGRVFLQLPIDLYGVLQIVSNNDQTPCIVKLVLPRGSNDLTINRSDSLLEIALFDVQSNSINNALVSERSSNKEETKGEIQRVQSITNMGQKQDRARLEAPDKLEETKTTKTHHNISFSSNRNQDLQGQVSFSQVVNAEDDLNTTSSFPMLQVDSSTRSTLSQQSQILNAQLMRKCKCKNCSCRNGWCPCRRDGLKCNSRCECVSCRNSAPLI